ncbi:MAG: DUF1080 domain-containing protein [Planctomycetota bacterium]
MIPTTCQSSARFVSPLLALLLALPLIAEEGEAVALFDGQSLSGWRGYNSEDAPEGWQVVDGTLHRSGGGGDIMTADEYDNFELTLDWKISEAGNSGIMYRVSKGDSAPYISGPEYQILDNDGHQDGGSDMTSAAALYGLYATDTTAPNPVGEWNTTRIVVDGNHVEHWLNGKKVVDCELGSDDWNERVQNSKFATWEPFGKNAKGHIVLQDHGDLVWFRNIKLRQL